jgi:hypothetical protein
MSSVGSVAIALGVLMMCRRVPLLVAPEATLRWFTETIASNGRLRALGGFAVTFGAAMVWAGTTEDNGLATFLTVFGLGFLGVGALVMLFPGIYRAIANPVLPSDRSGSRFWWRVGGLTGTLIGVLIIYFGALAL